jgi:hypothetical protein
VLTGGNGQIQGIGVAGWDSERKQWRQLWADKDRIVTVYVGGPAADGTFVLTSEPKGGGTRWRYTYRNIRPDGVDAEYASRGGEDGPWATVWSGHFDRIGPAGDNGSGPSRGLRLKSQRRGSNAGYIWRTAIIGGSDRKSARSCPRSLQLKRPWKADDRGPQRILDPSA